MNERLFNQRAENYALGRPGYADGVTQLVFERLLKPGGMVADIGSGTGIFARMFLERGVETFCVEPNAEMRARADAKFRENPRYHSVAASAEATGLPARAFELVTAASAFHWFDPEAFAAECRRILRPDGVFLAVMNCRDVQNPFSQRQHELCLRFCPNFSSLRHGADKAIPRLKDMLGERMQTAAFDFPLTYTKERFLARSLSSSYAPLPGTSACAAYSDALRRLMDDFFPGDEVVVPNATLAFWGSPREENATTEFTGI